MTVEVPGYRLAEPLGTGATGTVHEATRLADQQPVAIKLVHPALVDPQYVERLRREARLAAAAVDPGIVRVHEVGGDGDRAWLIMDRLSGPDLQRLLDDAGPLPPDRAAGLVAQVADAVDAVHRAGVIHRDLKPGNIILDGERPMVADFGVARQLVSLESSTGLDLTGGSDWLRSGTPSTVGPEGPPAGPLWGAMAGTVAYMAPEQWRGDEVSPATDVYALGGTLFALLTGRRPFDRSTLPELAYAVAMLPPPSPSEYDVPEAFDQVVRTAMAKEPADRYPTAATFAQAVRAAAAGAPMPVQSSPARSGSVRSSPVRSGAVSSGPVPVGSASGSAASAGASVDAQPSRARRRMRLVAVAVPLILIGGIGASVLVAEGRESEGDLVVCADDATVRDAPRSKTVIATVRRGDRLQATSARDGGTWVNVRLPDGRTGWSLSDYVRHQC